MKIFTWFMTLAFAAVCYTCWGMSCLIMKSLADSGRELDYLPAPTTLLFHPNLWILFCPVPWIIYSTVLTLRRELTPSAVFVFAGTLVLAVSLLMCGFFIAAVVPFLRLKA